ncbi:MAG: hypothetical protein A3K19_07005 [Lentisphaerae bacterium RIFOXYB12_FULL_65_16]|nr:MAG: hypothetical protein A3K18_12320 [Lentisphaerae bacterium RIFOXYA12_64_32]OGV93270.1 MAG: hypothetical protein A3K19_07005 [Lentisphaerae bacterium RIFOXYB12_FULL_65_16]
MNTTMVFRRRRLIQGLPLAVLALLLTAAPARARLDSMSREFGGRPFHGYYVNIAIEEKPFFQGINQAFEVIVLPAVVMTHEEVEQFSAFPYMTEGTEDGATYQWRQVGHVWMLFRNLNGESSAVELYVLAFPHEDVPGNELLFRQLTPSLFEDQKLEDRLDVLGVMGAVREGAVSHVVFMQGPVFQKQSGDSIVPVVVPNIEFLLHRYGINVLFSDLEWIYPKQDLVAPAAFRKLLAVGSRQDVIANSLERNAKSLVPLYKWTQVPANNALTTACYYVPSSPKKGGLCGGPMAAWLPKLNANHQTPIAVFPGAFTGDPILIDAINMARLVAQWWNDAAGLWNGNAFDTLTNQQKRDLVLRETLLRLPATHMFKDIYTRTIGWHSGGGGPDADGDSLAIMGTMRYHYQEPYQQVCQDPARLSKQRYPWTYSPALYTPHHAYPDLLMEEGDVRVANALFKAVEAFDPQTKCYIDSLFSTAAKDLDNNNRDTIQKLLVRAIVEGFQDRKANLEIGLRQTVALVNYRLAEAISDGRLTQDTAALRSDFRTGPTEPQTPANNLFLAALEHGLAFDDLEWLKRLTETYGNYRMPFSSLDADFTSRLAYLADNWQMWGNRMYLQGWPAIHWIVDPAPVLAALGDANANTGLLGEVHAFWTQADNRANLLANGGEKDQVTAIRNALHAIEQALTTAKTNLTNHQASRQTMMNANFVLLRTLLGDAQVTAAPPQCISDLQQNHAGLIWPRFEDFCLHAHNCRVLEAYYEGIRDYFENNAWQGRTRGHIHTANRTLANANQAVQHINQAVPPVAPEVALVPLNGGQPLPDNVTAVAVAQLRTDLGTLRTDAQNRRTARVAPAATAYNDFFTAVQNLNLNPAPTYPANWNTLTDDQKATRDGTLNVAAMLKQKRVRDADAVQTAKANYGLAFGKCRVLDEVGLPDILTVLDTQLALVEWVMAVQNGPVNTQADGIRQAVHTFGAAVTDQVTKTNRDQLKAGIATECDSIRTQINGAPDPNATDGYKRQIAAWNALYPANQVLGPQADIVLGVLDSRVTGTAHAVLYAFYEYFEIPIPGVRGAGPPPPRPADAAAFTNLTTRLEAVLCVH